MSKKIHVVGKAKLPDASESEFDFTSTVYDSFVGLIEDIYLFELNGSVDIKERLDRHFREGGTEVNTASSYLVQPTEKVH